MSVSIARQCDMGSGNKLELIREDDGDIILQIMPAKHRFSMQSVEICSSGTQSSETWHALMNLFEAMLRDELNKPQACSLNASTNTSNHGGPHT